VSFGSVFWLNLISVPFRAFISITGFATLSAFGMKYTADYYKINTNTLGIPFDFFLPRSSLSTVSGVQLTLGILLRLSVCSLSTAATLPMSETGVFECSSMTEDETRFFSASIITSQSGCRKPFISINNNPAFSL
jgi:hypothetical protein